MVNGRLGLQTRENQPSHRRFPSYSRLRFVVFGQREVRAFARIVEHDQHRESPQTVVLGDGESRGRFHVNGEIAGPIPGVDLGYAFSEERGGRPNRTGPTRNVDAIDGADRSALASGRRMGDERHALQRAGDRWIFDVEAFSGGHEPPDD